jgi:hypothetical protein
MLVFVAAVSTLVILVSAFALLRTPAEAGAPIEAIPLTGVTQETLSETAPAATETEATDTAGGASAQTDPGGEEALFEIDSSQSLVQFAIDEILRGSPFTAVGKTDQVAGQFVFDPADLSSTELGVIQVNARTLATDDGFVTPDVLDWYGRFADGRPGVIVVEATGIRDVPSGPLLRIGSDRFVPGLRRLVETVRERSEGRTRLFIQVLDFVAVRRRPEPATYFTRYLAIGDDLRRRLAEIRG